MWHQASVLRKHQAQRAKIGHANYLLKTYILVVHVHDSIEMFEPRLMLVMIGTAMLLRRRCRCLNSPASSSTIFSGMTSGLGEKSTLGIFNFQISLYGSFYPGLYLILLTFWSVIHPQLIVIEFFLMYWVSSNNPQWFQLLTNSDKAELKLQVFCVITAINVLRHLIISCWKSFKPIWFKTKCQ